MPNNILITGAAGFIGFHAAKKLLKLKNDVVCIDNLSKYYDKRLKRKRISILAQNSTSSIYETNICDVNALKNIFKSHKPDTIIHLAAQAGVRYSIENPQVYLDSNIQGFLNILEACRQNPVKHLIYASSSSVYGGNTKVPFSETDNVDRPVSLYAATKKADELMAYTYSHLYGIPATGLRFFTVYGPWGRPDMAYYKFTKNIIEGKPIDVYNYGKMERDFTYIDDIVNGIISIMDMPPVKDNVTVPHEIYNIGNNQPVALENFISILEEKIGKKAVKNYMEMQQGDVLKTYADISKLNAKTGFAPQTSLEDGLGKFVDWYKEYYGII